MKEGIGTKGIKEPKKLTNARPRYPTSEEKNGIKSQRSNRIQNPQPYIKKCNSKSLKYSKIYN